MNTANARSAIKLLVRPRILGILAGVVVVLFLAGSLLTTIKIVLWLLLGVALLLGGLAACFGFAPRSYGTEYTEQKANRVIAKICGGVFLIITLVLGRLPRAGDSTATGARTSSDGRLAQVASAPKPSAGEPIATGGGDSPRTLGRKNADDLLLEAASPAIEPAATTRNAGSPAALAGASTLGSGADDKGASNTDFSLGEGRTGGEGKPVVTTRSRVKEVRRPLDATELKRADPRNPSVVSFKDLVNFPEEYTGRVKLQLVRFHGGLRREADHNLFCVVVSSQDGKYAISFLSGKVLSFVVSEDFGRVLDLSFESNVSIMTNLYCELGRLGETPVAKIYRIETLARDRTVTRVFEDQAIVANFAKEYQSRCAVMLNVATVVTSSVGMRLVLIPPGTFIMGAMGDGNPNEKPAHAVRLTKAFYLEDREVTVAQFQRFIDDAEYDGAEKPHAWEGVDKLVSTTAECPVNNVNWFDAVLFCNWLSAREGRKLAYERTGEKLKIGNRDCDDWRCDSAAGGYRLPTEAEWEYTSRAGGTGEFCYGNGEVLLPQYASFVGNANGRTWPAGTRMANAWGLFDMHGNVHEWCWDRDGSYGAKAARDPTGADSGDSRLLRGGAFSSRPWNARSANRFWHYPTDRHCAFGFRVARTCP